MFDPKSTSLLLGPVASGRTSAAYHAARFFGVRTVFWSGEEPPYAVQQKLSMLGCSNSIALPSKPWNTANLEMFNPDLVIMDGAQLIAWDGDILPAGCLQRVLDWCKARSVGMIATIQTRRDTMASKTIGDGLSFDAVWQINRLVARCVKGPQEGREWTVTPMMKLVATPKACS